MESNRKQWIAVLLSIVISNGFVSISAQAGQNTTTPVQVTAGDATFTQDLINLRADPKEGEARKDTIDAIAGYVESQVWTLGPEARLQKLGAYVGEALAVAAQKKPMHTKASEDATLGVALAVSQLSKPAPSTQQAGFFDIEPYHFVAVVILTTAIVLVVKHFRDRADNLKAGVATYGANSERFMATLKEKGLLEELNTNAKVNMRVKEMVIDARLRKIRYVAGTLREGAPAEWHDGSRKPSGEMYDYGTSANPPEVLVGESVERAQQIMARGGEIQETAWWIHEGYELSAADLTWFSPTYMSHLREILTEVNADQEVMGLFKELQYTMNGARFELRTKALMSTAATAILVVPAVTALTSSKKAVADDEMLSQAIALTPESIQTMSANYFAQ